MTQKNAPPPEFAPESVPKSAPVSAPAPASIIVTVAATRGSVPRPEGTEMQVFADRQEGTIGGGALEWEALKIARAMRDSAAPAQTRFFPLGPGLGQCCGGAVELSFRPADEVVAPACHGAPVWIWGAGHVGRAIAKALEPVPDFAVTLADNAPDRLPEDLPHRIKPFLATDMPLAVAHAPQPAHHIIATYSHDIDLRLCDRLLHHGFSSCGLIGSATKWARFQKRLLSLGHSPARIRDITCPIGDPSLGKHPAQIAVGVAATLLAYETHAWTARQQGEIAS